MINDRISRSSRSDVHPGNDHFKVFIARASREQKWTWQRIHIEFLPGFHQFVDDNMFLCLWSYAKDGDTSLFWIWDTIMTSLIVREEKMIEVHCFFMCRVLIDEGHSRRTRRFIQNRRLTQFSWITKRDRFNSTCIQARQVQHATHEIRPNKFFMCGFYRYEDVYRSLRNWRQFIFTWRQGWSTRKYSMIQTLPIQKWPSAGYLTRCDVFSLKKASQL